MSGTSRGPGRPSQRDPATVERIRRIQIMASAGLTPAQIAGCEQCSESYVRLLMKAPVEAEGPTSTIARPRPDAPRRLNERALTHHAVLAMRRDNRLRRFEAAQRLFWLDCVMEVHALGDENGLPFGQDGDPFETHAEFATALGGSADHLEAFLRRGLLVRLADGGIDLPVRIGLKPKEKPRSERASALVQSFGASPDAPDDAETDATEITLEGGFCLRNGATEIPISFASGATETPITTPISFAASVFAHAAAAAAYAKENQPFSSSSSTDSRADAGATEIGISFASGATEIPQNGATEIPLGATEIPATSGAVAHAAFLASQSRSANPRRSELGAFADELLTMANLKRPPRPDELGKIQGWLDAGDTQAMILEVARGILERPNQPPLKSLLYLDDPIRKAREARRGSPGKTSTYSAPLPATPPLSDADKALRERLKPSQDAWIKSRSCPFAPTLDSFKSACATEKGSTVAHRWLELWSVWDDSGRPADLKPPDFTLMAQDPHRFEAALLEIEEELTAPTPPQAAD